MADWYFAEHGVQHGPVDGAAFDQLVSEGRVIDSTLVWHEGLAGWQPLAEARRSMLPMIAMPATPPTSGLAIASLVCGVVALATCTLVTGLPAVICGHMAIFQIRNAPLPMEGRGMAMAGLVTGYIAILPMVAALVFFLVFFCTAFTA
jgi:hypothetical protein